MRLKRIPTDSTLGPVAKLPAGEFPAIYQSVCLPYPPSVNHYWRYVNGRVLISAAGRQYRKTVADDVFEDGLMPMDGRLAVSLEVHCPDRRARDLDNVLKATLDSLQHAGVYQSDSQIDKLLIERSSVQSGGWVTVRLEVLR